MTITLRRRPLTLALLLLAGVMALLVLPPTSTPRLIPPRPVTNGHHRCRAEHRRLRARSAAVQVMRAFYTADYRHRDRWLATLKPLSSSDGYILLQNLIAPALWKTLNGCRPSSRRSGHG
jgi:hypothetical protein